MAAQRAESSWERHGAPLAWGCGIRPIAARGGSETIALLFGCAHATATLRSPRRTARAPLPLAPGGGAG